MSKFESRYTMAYNFHELVFESLRYIFLRRYVYTGEGYTNMNDALIDVCQHSKSDTLNPLYKHAHYFVGSTSPFISTIIP